jgi:hypothetical protein
MIVRIDQKDRDIVHRTCLEVNTKCTFYTIEKSPEMLTVEIDVPDGASAWYLARAVQCACDVRDSDEARKSVFKDFFKQD